MKISIKALISTVLLATAGFVAQSASAVTPVVFNNDGVAKFDNTTLAKNASFFQTFTFSGLAAGMYNIDASISGTRLTFDKVNPLDLSAGLKVLLDGHAYGTDGSLKYGTINYNGLAPLVLEVYGTTVGFTGTSSFNGTISVTAVPEPEVLGMMLGGLALVGVAARRKAKKAA